MDEKGLTVKGLIGNVIRNLGGITGIPVAMANDVARPIWEAIEDLKVAMDHLIDEEPDKAPEEVTEDVQS